MKRTNLPVRLLLSPVLLGLLGWALGSGDVRAAAEDAERERPEARAFYVEEGPEIDGRLDDAVWSRAEPLGSLTQVEPVEGAAPTERTVIRILRDDDALYFGVRCYDAEPDLIIAQRMQRDADVRSEDRITIGLDTFRDGRSGYLFQMNALGSRLDALIEYDSVRRDWDTIWDARARIDDEGWTLEVEIPFRSLSFDPNLDAWGLNILRAIRRRDERLRWADPYVHKSFVNFRDAGLLRGMKGVSQGWGLDVVPASSTSVGSVPTADPSSRDGSD